MSKNRSNLQWYKENEDGGLQSVSRSGCISRNNDSKFYVYCENQSVLSMEIRNVLTSDSGVYYCSMSGLDQTFHLANTLIVIERYPVKPTLSILASVEDHPRDSESTILLCAALNWTKEWDVIKWIVNGTEKKGWTTLDPDGSLRSLLVLQRRSVPYSLIICFIKKLTTGENISSNVTAWEFNKDEGSSSDCYMVLYVGLPILIAILLVHLVILAVRHRNLSKDTQQPSTHQERHVRFNPEDESVTYAAVKS
ncbi:uncharacterized protein [Eleutherodactylus coqui]|uniref:uncharacterized protein n=1 Tax=Eleutherodactylus coqui TaxID=57060 RepID=UPI0034619F00